MKLKKYLSKIIALSMGLCMITGYGGVYADSAINLEVTPNNAENYISLKWNAPDESRPYSYMIYSKKSTESTFQSIPAKDNVKVLNVYPSVGNTVKSWMEDPNEESSNGYGKGLISVDEVDIDDFNAYPDSYLKDADGNWKYDVVFIGAWDGNNEKYFNEAALESVGAFIDAGRGFLAGHDTYCFYDKLNMKQTPKLEKYGDTSVKLVKKGLLTNYPWKIGELGTDLTIPLSHSNRQYAYGDVWIEYNGNSMSDDPECTYYEGGNCTNNFYLTTWNNCAMIQTGHSKGKATSDEQKILANTIFYLAQVTEKTSWDDHKGQDVDGPTIPEIKDVSYDVASNKVNVDFTPSTDNGTTYDYYIEATNTETKEKTTSETKSGTVTTGLKGYSVIVDNNKDTIPTVDITTTETKASIDLQNVHSGDLYVHVAAVDNVGNLSEVSHYRYAFPLITLTPSTTELTKDPVKITAKATSEISKIIKVQTPDGNWVDGDTAYYDVDANGTYTFAAIDDLGIKVTQSIDISNIGDEDTPVILNIEPEKDKIHLGDEVQANLTIDNIQQIAAEDVRIKYDSSKLQFLGFEQVDGIKVVKDEQNEGELRVILASQGISNVAFMKKTLLKLNFKGISAGEALVDVTKGRVSDGLNMEKDLLDSECGQAIITVEDYNDVNKSGEFTLIDLAIDGRYYGMNPINFPEYITDIAVNGAIDDDDLLAIGQYMLENPNYNF